MMVFRSFRQPKPRKDQATVSVRTSQNITDMEKLISSIICILLVLNGCNNSSFNKVYSSKVAILFKPGESLEDKVPGVSEEELASIEYEKTMATYFLDSLNMPTEVSTDTLFTFKLSDGEKVNINTNHFSEWGIILFDPHKQPKMINLNELEIEYIKYFSPEDLNQEGGNWTSIN